MDAAAVADVDVAAAMKQAWAIASRIAAQDGHTPEEIRTIAKSAAVATEQALAKVAKSAASASAASGSGRAPPTKRRKANRSGGDLNSQEQSAPRHASATSDAASGGSSTSTPTIYLDLTAPVRDNGETPMAPSTARSLPGFVIRSRTRFLTISAVMCNCTNSRLSSSHICPTNAPAGRWSSVCLSTTSGVCMTLTTRLLKASPVLQFAWVVWAPW